MKTLRFGTATPYRAGSVTPNIADTKAGSDTFFIFIFFVFINTARAVAAIAKHTPERIAPK